MPTYDASPIFHGLNDAGTAIAQSIHDSYRNRQEVDYYGQKIDDLSKMTDPSTGQPLLDPDTLGKAYGMSLSQKKALVADAAFKHEMSAQKYAQDRATEQTNFHNWMQTDASERGWAGLTQPDYTPPAAEIEAGRAGGHFFGHNSAHSGSWLPMGPTGAGPGAVFNPPQEEIDRGKLAGMDYYHTGAKTGSWHSSTPKPTAAVKPPAAAAKQMTELAGQNADDAAAIAAKAAEIKAHNDAIQAGDLTSGLWRTKRADIIKSLKAEQEAHTAAIAARTAKIDAIRATFAPAPLPAGAAGDATPNPMLPPVIQPAGAGAPVVSTPAAPPAVDRTAQGGYVIGATYGTTKYLGGDPNKLTSWE